MREIRTSGSMSGDGSCRMAQATAPILDPIFALEAATLNLRQVLGELRKCAETWRQPKTSRMTPRRH